EVAGHTDNTGRYQTNMELSFARANSVKNYLIQVSPELATRLSARGYGPDMPKDTNKTANGRRNNRRVELQVTNKEALKEYK
ncbi:MAG: OmpA family protein, partial [Fibrobacter sp.]|nr:OmpA family protein [Fibrobacter sp.]